MPSKWVSGFIASEKPVQMSMAFLLMALYKPATKPKANDGTPFVLTEKGRRGKRVIYKLRAKLAGRARMDKESLWLFRFDFIAHS